MKCEDLLRALNDYVDGDLAPGVCAEFERHFASCEACRIVVDTVRKTIRIYREGRLCEMPLDFRRRLHEALRERWRQVRGPSSSGNAP